MTDTETQIPSSKQKVKKAKKRQQQGKCQWNNVTYSSVDINRTTLTN